MRIAALLSSRLVRSVAILATLLCAAILFFAVVVIPVLNADLAGRITETLTMRTDDNASTSPVLVRLVLSRMPADENAVDASLAIALNDVGKLPESMRERKNCLTATVQDRLNASFIAGSATVDCATTGENYRIVNAITTESTHFRLSAYPSVWGFPFDDVVIYPYIELHEAGKPGFLYPAKFEVQKAFPGRILKLAGDRYNKKVLLIRSPLEKMLVLISTFTFAVLTIVVTAKLFARETVLSGLQEVIAVAGYMVAAAGFRELLGFSRATGTGALELAIFGVPLIALCLGIASSMWRNKRVSNSPNQTP